MTSPTQFGVWGAYWAGGPDLVGQAGVETLASILPSRQIQAFMQFTRFIELGECDMLRGGFCFVKYTF